MISTSFKYHLELKQKESWSRPLIFHQKNPIPGCQPGTLSAWGSLHGFAEPQMRDSEPQRGTWTGLKLRGLLQDGVPQGTHISKRLGVLLRAAWQVPSWDLVFLKSQISLQHWDRQRLLSEGCYLVMEVPQTQWRGGSPLLGLLRDTRLGICVQWQRHPPTLSLMKGNRAPICPSCVPLRFHETGVWLCCSELREVFFSLSLFFLLCLSPL